MKKKILGSFALCAWLPFFFIVGEAWPSPWGFILATLGAGALFGTVELLTVGRESKNALHVTDSPWFVVALLTWIVFGWITHHLSPYWSLIVPLVAIVAAYGIFMLWPDPEPEKKPEDLAASTDTHQGT